MSVVRHKNLVQCLGGVTKGGKMYIVMVRLFHCIMTFIIVIVVATATATGVFTIIITLIITGIASGKSWRYIIKPRNKNRNGFNSKNGYRCGQWGLLFTFSL